MSNDGLIIENMDLSRTIHFSVNRKSMKADTFSNESDPRYLFKDIKIYQNEICTYIRSNFTKPFVSLIIKVNFASQAEVFSGF